MILYAGCGVLAFVVSYQFNLPVESKMRKYNSECNSSSNGGQQQQQQQNNSESEIPTIRRRYFTRKKKKQKNDSDKMEADETTAKEVDEVDSVPLRNRVAVAVPVDVESQIVKDQGDDDTGADESGILSPETASSATNVAAGGHDDEEAAVQVATEVGDAPIASQGTNNPLKLPF